MLYRWFVGLGLDDAAWDHCTYTKNRDRLIEHEIVRALFERVMQQAQEARLLSDAHFSVDGTMIRAWASHKSFVPKDGPPPPSAGSRGNPEVDFKGQRRSNDTLSEGRNLTPRFVLCQRMYGRARDAPGGARRKPERALSAH